MEALAEQIIAVYLTRGGKVFIAPQYAIPGPNTTNEWACPDFVALDFERREIVVVEVTTGADLSTILTKVKDREKQWFVPLRDKLKADRVVDDAWSHRFLGFVRSDNLKKAKDATAGVDGVTFFAIEDVTFFAIEDVTFSWSYWESRRAGLPR